MMKSLRLGICALTLAMTSMAHAVITFDDNVTPDILFGSGNANGGFTVDRQGSVELGLRAKVRFPVALNVFNSNGDGTYSFNAGNGMAADDPLFNFEWSVNTDYNGMTGDMVNAFTYLLEIDYDPGAGTNFLAWDHITSPTGPIPFTTPTNPGSYDHSFGTNGTANGGGVEAGFGDSVTYASYVASNNVVQNSWRHSFWNEPPFAFDPNVGGTYDIRLTAYSGMAIVAQVGIQILVDRVTPDILFGSGNANGGFTLDQGGGVEIGLRGKLRFPVPMNVYNSNLDGTYTFEAGQGPMADDPVWNFDWSVNTDFNGMSGNMVDDFTYLLEIDYDPGAGTNFLAWDHITSPTAPIPWTAPVNPGAYDHSFGTNSTPNGGGVEAGLGDAVTYASYVASNNVVQNSWRLSFFNEPPYSFDPNAIGRYDIRLTAFSGVTPVASAAIQVKVVVSANCTLDSECDDGLACNGMETCNLGTNQCEFGTPVVCSGQCETGVCLDPTGTCQPETNGILCQDGQECTVGDTCQGGVCTPGAGADTDADGDCDSEEATCGCSPTDGAEICALPNRLVGLAGNKVGEVLLNWHTPTVRRVPVATDPSCQQSGVCTAGRCTAGQINDLCTTNGDCDLPISTCRVIVNYADIGDLTMVFARVNRDDQTSLFPATPGCSRKIDVPIDSSRLSNRLRTKATGTIDGRPRRDLDTIIYR
jgi:hypothetical protein